MAVMRERDLVLHEGGKLIDRNELHQPGLSRKFECECGQLVGYPDCLDHRCAFTNLDGP